MEKKNIDWSNLGFGYMVTDKRYVSMFKNGAWDDGALISDDKIVMSEDAVSCTIHSLFLRDSRPIRLRMAVSCASAPT